jgi:sterol desaturase/sphingolipid hydroxylase (fatty acid hydroxylase superfamily)
MDMRREGRGLNRIGDGGHPQRVRLFQSEWLERLTVISPRAFAVTWAAILAFLVWATLGIASPGAWFGLVAAGLLLWSLFEYCMHRYLFHLELDSDLGRWFAFVIHGNHHEDPKDPHRSLMPPIVSVTLSAMIWGGLVLAFGATGTVIFLGFEIGYVCYDSVHYACHQRPARSGIMKILRQHHIRHHYGRTNGNYAITTIFWDHLFGSYITAKAAATRPERQPHD